MKALLLLALASTPSGEDMDAMFDRSDAFVRVCAPAIEAIDSEDLSDEQAMLGSLCVAFANGAAQAKAIASKYEIDGLEICAQAARGRDVLSTAFELYRSNDDARNLAPAALLLIAQARVSPCR